MKIKGVFLDRDSLGLDLDMAVLNALPIDWVYYSHTAADQTVERCLEADIVISNKVVLHFDIIQQLPRLKHIAVAATGTNNVDKLAAAQANISVSNIKDYAGSSVAQLVFALLLEMMTHANKYANLVKQGQWSKSKSFCLLDYPISELAGKTLGLIGYGTLAKSVEHLARAFGMKILIAERKSSLEIRAGRTSFDGVIKQADVISLHCPLDDNTKALISTAEFESMKPTALLINTARGGVVDELALIQALNNNEISAAATDVLNIEPPPEDHPLIDSMPENLVVTPHIAWASIEARTRLLLQLAENIEQHVLN